MVIADWKNSLETLLKELYEINFGYPLGENKVIPIKFEYNVREVLKANEIDIQALEDLYQVSDGISLPDVQNGYFLKSLSKLIEGTQGKEPVSISGEIEGSILVLGSTGGGQKIALFQKDKSILLLENGLVENGVFHAESHSIKVIAASFEEFLDKLLQDVDAFVTNNPNYIYIA